jgi:PAS domain S-box-containing protein
MSETGQSMTIVSTGGSGPAFLTGGGEMGAMMRAHDWSTSSLGPPDSWPQALGSAVGLMLANRHVMFVAWGPDLAFLYNDAYRPVFGAKHPWALGRPFKEIWPEAWEHVNPLVNAALGGEATWSENLHLVLERNGYPEDCWFTFSYSPVRDDAAAVVGLFCAATETTGQVLAERARDAAEARLVDHAAELERLVAERTAEYARVWTNSRDILVIADPDGVFSAVNPAWTTILGHDPSEVAGRNFRDFVWEDHTERTAQALDAAMAGVDANEFENLYRHKDGSLRRLSLRTTEEGGLIYGYARDVTEQRAQAEQLQGIQENLRQAQKMEAIGQLTGGVAHDFNNLLTPIVGSLEMLQRLGLGGEREQRLISGALQAAEMATTLVQRLLAFARRQPLQATAVDVGRLVASIGSLLGSTCGPQVRIVIDTADDLPPANADLNQLEMALINLGINACDAMPKGGTLRISARAELIRQGHRSKLGEGEYIRLSVTDTGIGMDEATLARAAEPFFTTKGVGKGTGLGLSMAHGLAAQLGGALTIDSRQGAGTNVDLWLPLSAEAAGPVDKVPAAPSPRSPLGKVLLVDDQELVRKSTADMLVEIGCTVVEAASAEEALRLVEHGFQPDLLITDYLMPGMNGTELVGLLRARWPGLRVLIVSGYSETYGLPSDLPRLAKPFRNSDLAASLANLQAADEL